MRATVAAMGRSYRDRARLARPVAAAGRSYGLMGATSKATVRRSAAALNGSVPCQK
jgi:hypothetical protein